MRVTFWGTRGSLPTPLNAHDFRDKAKHLLMNAKRRDLASEASVDSYLDSCRLPKAMTFGGNTPCVEINKGTDRIILDCGSGLRQLGIDMMEKGVEKGSRINILMTHSHWDHIMGFPFFSPALAGTVDIHVYGVHPNLKDRFDQQMDRVHFPITMDEMSASITFHQIPSEEEITIDQFKITNKGLHHPGGSYAYRISTGGKDIIFATDGEYNDPSNNRLVPYIDFFRDADVLIFDAMYSTLEQAVEKENYGHSTAVIGVDLALYAEVKKLILFHHDPESDDKQIADSFFAAQDYLDTRRNEFPDNGMIIESAYDGMIIDV
ncbi:MBL fold metallo-hydrolase [Candidatus Latescibacterota bacterium]